MDSNDQDRIEDARGEIKRVLEDGEMRDVPLFVFSDKQDLPQSMTAAEVSEKMGLRTLQGHSWFIQGACMTTR